MVFICTPPAPVLQDQRWAFLFFIWPRKGISSCLKNDANLRTAFAPGIRNIHYEIYNKNVCLGWKDSTVRKAFVFHAVNLGSTLSIMYGPWSTTWAQSQTQVESTARCGPKITTGKKICAVPSQAEWQSYIILVFSSFSSTLHQMPLCYLTTFFRTILCYNNSLFTLSLMSIRRNGKFL